MRSVLLLTPLFCAASLPAQVVEGRVLNAANGHGISGAKVELRRAGPARPRSADAPPPIARTDAAGRFHIEAVPEGIYTVRYIAPGFCPSPEPGGSLPPFAVGSTGNPVQL